MFYFKAVPVKLLPFDNKSEMSVVVDLPKGATLEDTERTLFSIADAARQLPEIRSIEIEQTDHDRSVMTITPVTAP